MVSWAVGPGKFMSRCGFWASAPGGVLIKDVRPKKAPNSSGRPTLLQPRGGLSSSLPGLGAASGRRNHSNLAPDVSQETKAHCCSSCVLPPPRLFCKYLATISRIKSFLMIASLFQGEANGRCPSVLPALKGWGMKPSWCVCRNLVASRSMGWMMSKGSNRSKTTKPWDLSRSNACLAKLRCSGCLSCCQPSHLTTKSPAMVPHGP
mmetsp:Transcript_20079/g.36300  ORF Transcript_20079/g.36300 Transcript_20079/m.36300 type:complete len:206 (-) Transcript_20079:229-846(-)